MAVEWTGRYICAAPSLRTMQQISFAIGHFLEWTMQILPALGWLPSIAISVLLFVGMVYWLNLQGKYNRKAKQDGTIA